MPRIATCTTCWQRVTVPEDAEEGQLVRCPLCGAEYPLAEALAGVTEPDPRAEAPPELVPVATDLDDQTAPEVETEEAADMRQEPTGDAEETVEEAEQPATEEEPDDGASGPETEQEEAKCDEAGGEAAEPAGQDRSVRVRCPECEAEFPLSRLIVADAETELGPAVATVLSQPILAGIAVPSEAGTGGVPAIDVWAKADAMPQIDLGQGPTTQAPMETDAGAFAFARHDAEAADATAGVVGARPRRKKRQKSVMRELASWVLGGLGGLFIAYYVLNWWKGEQFDKLPIPLPGVPHTYRHSPDWFPNWLRPAPDAEDAASDETAVTSATRMIGKPPAERSRRSGQLTTPACRRFVGRGRVPSRRRPARGAPA